MKWIDQLLPIIEQYKDGGEPLDGDEVDSLCSIIRAKINLQEGNITDSEYDSILDGRYRFRFNQLLKSAMARMGDK